MEEEVKDEQLEDTPTAEVVKTDKKYSEAEVQKMIQERIKREKENSRKQNEDFTQRETEYKTTIENYETYLNKLLETQKGDLPESVIKLLEKLSVMEQLEWLADEANHIEKRNIPSTPKGKIEVALEQRKIKKVI